MINVAVLGYGTVGSGVVEVIEGNKDDMVDYRILWINSKTIRGFALPDYKYKAAE